MKITVFALTLAAVAVAVYLFAQPARSAETGGAAPPVADAKSAAGFAVVELFTSQGCSSCPPADRVLQSLSRQAHEDGLPVYALSYHVDYWDGLGWPDPYASKQATHRQYAYAQAFRSSRVYTPQMIVNGQTEFVGSRGRLAEQAVQSALAAAAEQHLAIRDLRRDDQNVTAQIELTGETPPGSTLLVALVEPNRTNAVPRGENRGRELSHTAVVRDFVQLDAGAAAEAVKLRIPEDADGHPLELIAFVQEGVAGPIRAAAKQAVP
ncbi:MAG: DUF1223 domain-containing protein [Planctomycetota bacterium]